MSKIWHQAIVPIAAIVGAQLPGLVFQSPHPAQSNSLCDAANSLSSFWQGRTEDSRPGIARAAQLQVKAWQRQITGQENRTMWDLTDEEAISGHPPDGSPQAAAASGNSAPIAGRTTAVDDRPLPLTGMTQAEWDQKRRADAGNGIWGTN